MAEKLKRTQPTSSIATALNMDAIRAATEPAPAPAVPRASTPSPVVRFHAPTRVAVPSASRPPPPEVQPFVALEPTGEFPSVMRQFQLTPSADAVLSSVIDAYSSSTGLRLTRSEFLRAVLYALAPTIAFHEREGRGIGPLRRAKNEARLFYKRDELEQAIASAFARAMRAPPRG